MARKLWRLARIVLFLSFLLVLRNLHLLLSQNQNVKLNIQNEPSTTSRVEVSTVLLDKEILEEIVIAVVVCGDRVNETILMIKSAVLFSRSPIKVIIFGDDNALLSLKQSSSHYWSYNSQDDDGHISSTSPLYRKAKLDLRPITFPSDKAEEWKKLFKPCASQRLFLPVSSI